MLDTSEFKTISRKNADQNTIISIPGHEIGGKRFTIFAGPCRVENKEMIIETARFLKDAGANVLRAGAFKPCTGPHCDWGRGEAGLVELRGAGDIAGLPVITEAMDEKQLELVNQYSDIIQVGMRNAQNYTLLREIGQNYQKPVFLKRGSWMNLRELLCSAEWVAAVDEKRNMSGNPNVMVCERGIVALNDHMRWTLDIAMIPSFKRESHLPVIVDISHGTGGKGNSDYYLDLCRAVVAAGADGLMLEVHPRPKKSMSDADQTISFAEFDRIIKAIRPVAEAVGKEI
jgi:3-deoxy-7-phosphoheptulonate synthase